MVAIRNPLEILWKVLKFLILVALIYGLARISISFFKNNVSSIDDAKTISEIINNLAVALGIIIGGLWAYYQYLKGRLFAPKIHISYSNSIIKMSNEQRIILIEISIKNIGLVRVIPTACLIDVLGFKINEGNIDSNQIFSDSLSPKYKNKQDEDVSFWSKFKILRPDIWYIEPNETENLSTLVMAPSSYEALSTEVTFLFNDNLTANQTFVIRLS